MNYGQWGIKFVFTFVRRKKLNKGFNFIIGFNNLFYELIEIFLFQFQNKKNNCCILYYFIIIVEVKTKLFF